MARRKRSKITSKNLASRLTRKGTYYVDFSRMDILVRLSSMQRNYLNMAVRENKVLFISREEYWKMPREGQKEYLKSIIDILSGETFKGQSRDMINGYARALAQNGLVDLGNALKEITKNMSNDRIYKLLSQFPRIEDVYPPRSKKGRKRQEDAMPPDERRSRAVADIIKIMKKYGYQLDEQTETYCETFDLDIEED